MLDCLAGDLCVALWGQGGAGRACEVARVELLDARRRGGPLGELFDDVIENAPGIFICAETLEKALLEKFAGEGRVIGEIIAQEEAQRRRLT